MFILDAGKAIAIAVKMCYQLVAMVEDRKETRRCSWLRSRSCHFCALPSLLSKKASSAVYVAQKFKGVMQRLRKMTGEELDETWIDVDEAKLLNELVRYMKVFVLAELCEVMVPLMYMLVIGTLHSPIFGYNQERFYLFDHLDETYDDAMMGNVVSFFIETAVLLAAEVIIFRSIGFDVIYFAGVVLKQDYSYLVLALAACCSAWLTVLVKHGGHNLYFWRSFLFPD